MEKEEEIKKNQESLPNLYPGIKMQSLQKTDFFKKLIKKDVSEGLMEKNKNCTYFLLGEPPMNQQMYICGRYDIYEPIPMCKSCYDICHKECNTKEIIIIKPSQIPFNKHLQKKTANTKVRSLQNRTAFKTTQQKIEEKIALIQEQNNANRGFQIFSCLCGKIHKYQAVQEKMDDKKNQKKNIVI